VEKSYLAECTHVKTASCKGEIHKRRAKNLYDTMFVFELDDECKISKNKVFMIEEMFLSATSVGLSGDRCGLNGKC